jgi:hypothetical protein
MDVQTSLRRPEMHRKETNVGIVERVIRIGGGGALAIAALVLLLGGGAWWALALEVAGIALGIDFVYTGLTGYCPLYNKLGWATTRRRHSEPRPQAKGLS